MAQSHCDSVFMDDPASQYLVIFKLSQGTVWSLQITKTRARQEIDDVYTRGKLSTTNIYFNTDSIVLSVCVRAQVNMCVCGSRCVLGGTCTHVIAYMWTSDVNLSNSPLFRLLSFEIPSPI